jgi:hypothetical protein
MHSLVPISDYDHLAKVGSRQGGHHPARHNNNQFGQGNPAILRPVAGAQTGPSVQFNVDSSQIVIPSQ